MNNTSILAVVLRSTLAVSAVIGCATAAQLSGTQLNAEQLTSTNVASTSVTSHYISYCLSRHISRQQFSGAQLTNTAVNISTIHSPAIYSLVIGPHVAADRQSYTQAAAHCQAIVYPAQSSYLISFNTELSQFTVALSSISLLTHLNQLYWLRPIQPSETMT